MRRSHALRLGAAAVVAVGTAGAVHGYQTYASWPTSTATFYVNPANADVSASAAIGALQAGMNSWNNQAGTPFRLQYGGTVGDTAISVDNRNVVIFRPNYSSGSTIATTYTWRDGNNKLLDADVTFYTTDWTFFAGSSGCAGSRAIYIEDVAAHEFGHAIGLNHTSVGDATMYPGTSTCSQAWRTLASDDIAAARSLYGTGTGSTNTAPTVSIATPVSGSSFVEGTAISFTGSASDTQDGNISASLQWTDNGTAVFQGASFSRVLTAGTHTIVARSTDSGGLQGSRQISVTVTAAAVPTNTAPTVTITSPLNGASVAGGTSITFSGSSVDTQSGNLSASLQWTDNGSLIGQGASFSRVLTAGTHTIVARSTDGGGLQGSRQISVTVTSTTTSGGSLRVTGRKVRGYQQADLTWNGLSATSIDVYRNNSRVMSTANDGVATDPINKKGSGTYTYKVCAAGTTTCSNNASVVF